MNVQKTPLLLSLLIVAGISTLASTDAMAGRIRGHVSGTATDGTQVSAGGAAGRGANGSYARGHRVVSDGAGNASAVSHASVEGANGGSAYRQGSAYKNADGSAGHQSSASVNTANGTSGYSSGSISKSADGSVAGARSTSVSGANGNSYNGTTTVGNGAVTHTGTCTNASGATIDCSSLH